MTPGDKNLQHFTDTFSLEHLITELTCFKWSPRCISFIFTNRKSCFKNTWVAVTGLSDFRKRMGVSWKSDILKALPEMKN